jgi:hypothetical protein
VMIVKSNLAPLGEGVFMILSSRDLCLHYHRGLG